MGEEEKAIEVARSMRGMGFKVVRDLAKQGHEEALAYCRRNGISYLLILTPGREDVVVEDVETGKKVHWKAKDILAGRLNLSSLKRG